MGDGDFNIKKVIGSCFPFILISYTGCIYFGIVVLQYWLKECKNSPSNLVTWWSIAILVAIHFLIIMVLWSYLSSVCVDPGAPPPFWVSYHIFLMVGILSRKSGRQKTQLLRLLSVLQAGKVPPLLHLREVRAQHGPPLSMAS